MSTLLPRTFAITYDQKSKVLALLNYYDAELHMEGKAILDMLVTLPEMLDSIEEAQEPLPTIPTT